MGEVKFQRLRQEAISHIEFALEVYQLQIDEGRYFLHEHPSSATSWQLPQMKKFILRNSVELAHMHMCQVGMVIDSKPVLKPTTWMTNAPKLAATRKTHFVFGAPPTSFC